MYLQIDCSEFDFRTIAANFNQYENLSVFSMDSAKNVVFVSPNEITVSKAINISSAYGIRIKFAFCCFVPDDEMGYIRRVYCGFFESGRVSFVKAQSFTSAPNSTVYNNFYSIVNYIFSPDFHSNQNLVFEYAEDFISEINVLHFSRRDLIFTKADIYKKLKEFSKQPRYIKQVQEEPTGYSVAKFNLEQEQTPESKTSVKTHSITNINGFDVAPFKKIIFLDFETNGLPTNKNHPESWPDIVQASWVIYTLEGDLVDVEDMIIKPTWFTINDESEAIHGIGHKKALRYGIPFDEMIEKLNKALSECNIIVSHNLDFDMTVMFAGMYKYNQWCIQNNIIKRDTRTITIYNPDWFHETIKQLFKFFKDERFPWWLTMGSRWVSSVPINKDDTIFYCTMAESADVLFGDGKWRKLEILYKELFGQLPDTTLHNSLNDVWVTKQCFYEMYRRGLVEYSSKKYFLNQPMYDIITRYLDSLRF